MKKVDLLKINGESKILGKFLGLHPIVNEGF